MSGTLKSRRVLKWLETCPLPTIANTAGELLKALEEKILFACCRPTFVILVTRAASIPTEFAGNSWK